MAVSDRRVELERRNQYFGYVESDRRVELERRNQYFGDVEKTTARHDTNQQPDSKKKFTLSTYFANTLLTLCIEIV